jgi:hypothetical protein
MFLGILISFFVHLASAQEVSWLLTKASHTSGPNCWNGALVQAGVLKNHRFVGPEEFQYLLQKNCRAVSAPSLGSLGRMLDDQGEVHAFIWVDPQTVYAKHSDGTFDSRGYELMSFAEMLRSYAIKKECAMNPNGKNCQRIIEYYECAQPQVDLAKQMDLLQKTERLLHHLVFSSNTKISFGDDCPSAEYFQRIRTLVSIKNELKVLSQKNIFDESYLDLWLQSVRYQVSESQQNMSHYRCKKISKKKKYFWYKEVKEMIDQLRSNLR